MCKPKRVADLVCCKLADAGKSELHGIISAPGAGMLRSRKSLENQAILTDPQRPQRHVPLDDLSGAGVIDRTAIRPAPGGSMHPLHHVVTNIQRVSPCRHQFHPECIDEPRFLESLCPPVAPIDECAAHRFGRAAIDVINDGFGHRRT